MSKLMLILSLALSVAACKSKSTCEKVYDHTLELLPDEMKSKLGGDDAKAHAIEKCEKGSDEAKQCALDAKSFEDLMKCPRK